MANEPKRDESRAASRRARGRRVAMTVYYTIVTFVGGAAAVEITRQVLFAPRASGAAVRGGSCRDGVRSLATALARARDAAAAGVGRDGSEDVALARFRGALEPEWGDRDGVASACKASPTDATALDAIERLRYAEEHAVRREASELAPLRREVHGILQALPP